MGTQDPLVHIEAATLAGGENNQDRYAYGNGWAFVLDGASSFSETPPVHDGGWYAEQLKCELSELLERSGSTARTSWIVAQAIEKTAALHDTKTQGPCPASTIAIARWNSRVVDMYVLGDSCAAFVNPDGQVKTLIEDSRIDRLGISAATDYRERLVRGSGFDPEHKKLLAEVQARQMVVRNQPERYWIASDDPSAAEEGISRRLPLTSAQIYLFSDGLTTVQDSVEICTALFNSKNVGAYLTELQTIEREDPRADRFPRSKPHDDKTAVCIRFNV